MSTHSKFRSGLCSFCSFVGDIDSDQESENVIENGNNDVFYMGKGNEKDFDILNYDDGIKKRTKNKNKKLAFSSSGNFSPSSRIESKHLILKQIISRNSKKKEKQTEDKKTISKSRESGSKKESKSKSINKSNSKSNSVGSKSNVRSSMNNRKTSSISSNKSNKKDKNKKIYRNVVKVISGKKRSGNVVPSQVDTYKNKTIDEDEKQNASLKTIKDTNEGLFYLTYPNFFQKNQQEEEDNLSEKEKNIKNGDEFDNNGEYISNRNSNNIDNNIDNSNRDDNNKEYNNNIDSNDSKNLKDIKIENNNNMYNNNTKKEYNSNTYNNKSENNTINNTSPNKNNTLNNSHSKNKNNSHNNIKTKTLNKSPSKNNNNNLLNNNIISNKKKETKREKLEKRIILRMSSHLLSSLEKKKKLEEKKEQKFKEECTFKPMVFNSPSSSPRPLSKFLETQQKFLEDKKDKVKKLKEIMNEKEKKENEKFINEEKFRKKNEELILNRKARSQEKGGKSKTKKKNNNIYNNKNSKFHTSESSEKYLLVKFMRIYISAIGGRSGRGRRMEEAEVKVRCGMIGFVGENMKEEEKDKIKELYEEIKSSEYAQEENFFAISLAIMGLYKYYIMKHVKVEGGEGERKKVEDVINSNFSMLIKTPRKFGGLDKDGNYIIPLERCGLLSEHFAQFRRNFFETEKKQKLNRTCRSLSPENKIEKKKKVKINSNIQKSYLTQTESKNKTTKRQNSDNKNTTICNNNSVYYCRSGNSIEEKSNNNNNNNNNINNNIINKNSANNIINNNHRYIDNNKRKYIEEKIKKEIQECSFKPVIILNPPKYPHTEKKKKLEKQNSFTFKPVINKGIKSSKTDIPGNKSWEKYKQRMKNCIKEKEEKDRFLNNRATYKIKNIIIEKSLYGKKSKSAKKNIK